MFASMYHSPLVIHNRVKSGRRSVVVVSKRYVIKGFVKCTCGSVKKVLHEKLHKTTTMNNRNFCENILIVFASFKSFEEITLFKATLFEDEK